MAMSGSVARPVWRVPGVNLDHIGLCTLLVFPLALLLSWPRISTVWQTGVFYDPDDAMRMVQVRDWMAGQGWFDLVAHRLDPPAGVLMHWSRIVDVPIATSVRLFGLVASPIGAERLARLVFPLGLAAAMIAATAWSARALAGAKAVFPAAILILFSGITFDQFQPGRIGHHAPQVLLLTLAVGTTLRGLDPRRPGFAMATGGLIALSIAIGLENLPFFAVLLCVPPLAWVVRGERFAPGLKAFATGLGLAAPTLFVLTVPPERYLAIAPDAFSLAQLAGLLGGAAGSLLLCAFSAWLGTPLRRGLGALAFGLVLVGCLHAAFPGCLGDPYSAMDPVVKRLWLDNVGQALPVRALSARHPEVVIVTLCPILCAIVFCLLGLWCHRRHGAGPWLMLTALVGIGLLGTLWEIRVASSLSPLVLLGAAWAVAASMELARRRGKAAYAALPFVVVSLCSAITWAMVPDGTSPEAETQAAAAEACRSSEALAPFAGFPAAEAFAPIDSGAHLLAYTRLSVPAGPYHRDQHGLRLVLDGLRASPDAARAIVAGSGASLLIACRADPLLAIIAKEAPDSLAAALREGRAPAWLKPIGLDGATPNEAFRVE